MRTGLPVEVDRGVCPFTAFQQLLPKSSDSKVITANTHGQVEVEPVLFYNSCLGDYCKLYDRQNMTCIFVTISKLLSER